MTLKPMPQPQAFERPAGYTWDAPADAVRHWAEKSFAAEADEPNTISIYGVIGDDMFGEGFTAKRMAGALRSIGPNAVTVNVNSPGGDMFEGLAIYNLLREHPAEITVKVMGVAASAASLVAMSGDRVLMGAGAVMMIHNAWGMVIGNRHDFADAASVFETFDASMAAIYAARTGKDSAAIMAMLDGPTRASDGTYMTAAEAVAAGFADGQFDGPGAAASARNLLPESIRAERRLYAALADTGMPRKEREKLLISAKGGAREAALTVTREADAFAARAAELLQSIRS
jgi:ATP-dependent Clp protease, protease subunit